TPSGGPLLRQRWPLSDGRPHQSTVQKAPQRPPSMRRYALTLTLALAASSCARDGEPPAAERRVAQLTREIRIDGHEHDLVPFERTSGGAIAVDEDGTIAISQTQDHVVRFFDADGEHLGEFGGDGSGPGEFDSPTRLGWIGDSLWVYDPGLRRVTVLTSAREFARTVA